jgi:hypothetical protein
MRYLGAAIAVALLPAAARPPAWRLAATSHATDPADLYAANFVDTSSIRRKGDTVSYRSFTIWEQGFSSGDNARSWRSADCRSHHYRLGPISYYKGTVAVESGTLIPESSAGFETAIYREIDAVCGAMPWLTRKVADPYARSRSAFVSLRRGGHWPLRMGR